jgi:hypothetical protein
MTSTLSAPARRALAVVIAAALALTAGVSPASAADPDTLSLPDGFQPEGIAIGKQPYAYLGSRSHGDILKVDLHTGKSVLLSHGPGTPSLGLKLDDRGRLFVAGGTSGDARVLDATTGQVLKIYHLETGAAFVNDVVLTRGAAWFTDSANPVLFKLPLGKNGELPDAAVRVPLTGVMGYRAGTNANGITGTPDGRNLLIVQSNTGRLFRTSFTGRTTPVDLGGESLLNGDGMVLRGRNLYVVQNRDNAITKIRLDKDVDRGAVQSRTKDVRFDVPTTLAAWGGQFYLPNARLTTTATPATKYDVVSVAIP